MIFDKVTIIGMGLIGSSMARALRTYNAARTIIAADAALDVIETVKSLGIADVALTDLRQSVAGSDLIILAVPVGAYDSVGEVIAPLLKDGAIITDVGGVKDNVITQLKKHLPDCVEFVPAHPIAGTEFSGPAAGFDTLFQGRWCILTPLPDTALHAVGMVTQMWEAFGSNVEIMDAKHHDLVLAITSHLPHLIAYTIVGTADDLADDLKSEVIQYSASGFRDFTRIASSDPVMWRDIFLHNKDAVLEILGRFTEDLTALQRAIRKGDGDYIQGAFWRTRTIRKQIIDAGQADYPAPNAPPVSKSQDSDTAT